MTSAFKKMTATVLFTLPCCAFAADKVTQTAEQNHAEPTLQSVQTTAAIDVKTLTPQQQAQLLMQKLVPFAAENITEFGEFYPFGAAVNAQGEIIPVAGHEGKEFVEQQSAMNNIFMRFKQGIKEDHFILTAVLNNQLIQSPDKQIPVQAIAIYLDHKDGFSRVVYLPYIKTEQGVQYGKMMMNAGNAEMFFGK